MFRCYPSWTLLLVGTWITWIAMRCDAELPIRLSKRNHSTRLFVLFRNFRIRPSIAIIDSVARSIFIKSDEATRNLLQYKRSRLAASKRTNERHYACANCVS